VPLEDLLVGMWQPLYATAARLKLSTMGQPDNLHQPYRHRVCYCLSNDATGFIEVLSNLVASRYRCALAEREQSTNTNTPHKELPQVRRFKARRGTVDLLDVGNACWLRTTLAKP
jgi:hypothetical protein